MLAAMPVFAVAQTAAILPNARTQFIDANGNPLVGGTVGFYIPSTLTNKTTWQNSGETIANTNPVVLDALGSALIWGQGSYREILKNSSGVVVWDGLTASAGAGAGGGTVTSISSGTGLTGGTITTSGTLALDLTKTFLTTTNGLVPSPTTVSGRFLGDDGAWHAVSGLGTVTSITCGTGLSGGTITTSGTCSANNTVLGFQGLSNTWTAYNQHTAGTSTANTVWDSWVPSDYGAGKPALSLQKDATANSWTWGLWDGSAFTGVIHLAASTIAVPSALTVAGSITLAGSPVCTTATGCPGGGGGGSYATVYDVAATYGGDPTGTNDNVTPFNKALAACASTGGIIWFRAGTFRFNSGINDNVTGCNIVGSGPQATNFYYYAASGDFVSVNAYNVNVSGLAIFSGGSWTSGYGLAVGVSAGASLGHYNDLYFSGIPGFIHLTGASETKFTNIYGVNPTGASAFLCDGAGASAVYGTRWNNVALGYGTTNTSTNGFHMGSGCNTWAMSQISSSGAARGSGNNCLLVDSGSAFLVLDDFECDHSVVGGTINGGTGVQITNSWFGSTLSGNGLTFGAGFAGFASVSNSHIRDNLYYGVLIAGSGGIQLTGNVISGNASGQVAVGANISNFQINSNQLGVPGDPTSTYGAIVNTGTSNYYTITANLCGSTTSTCVADGGSGVKKSITGNVGP